MNIWEKLISGVSIITDLICFIKKMSATLREKRSLIPLPNQIREGEIGGGLGLGGLKNSTL